jgi:hypothetical protein
MHDITDMGICQGVYVVFGDYERPTYRGSLTQYQIPNPSY